MKAWFHEPALHFGPTNPPTSREVSTTHKDLNAHDNPITSLRDGTTRQSLKDELGPSRPVPRTSSRPDWLVTPPEQASSHSCRNSVLHFPEVWWNWQQNIPGDPWRAQPPAEELEVVKTPHDYYLYPHCPHLHRLAWCPVT